MAIDEIADGCCATAQCGQILAKLIDALLKLTGKVDAKTIYAWQQQIRALLYEMPVMEKKMFLRTRGGAQMAHLALVKVKDLDDMVKRSASALPADDANRTVEKAMRDMTREVNALIEFTLSLM
ncbi:MAG: hypothetical protein P4L43_20945 [Syntrophobacteraceae bacterium]|nr:hypothetical protein [Syntrophobacteraceae bacterium]